MRAVGAGTQPETLRLHRTNDIVAFGRHDTVSPGYRDAVRAAIEQGFTPIERLAGGRAAVFHTGTLAFAWATPTAQPRSDIGERFTLIADVMKTAIAAVGVEANIGALPGEYCPGAYSVHGEHRIKLMGVGQRLVRGAAHVGGVICVRSGARIRDVLVPVYRSLELPWDPTTAGAIDEFVPTITLEAVQSAVLDSFDAKGFDFTPGKIPIHLLQSGADLAPDHISAV